VIKTYKLKLPKGCIAANLLTCRGLTMRCIHQYMKGSDEQALAFDVAFSIAK
jgi:hypothetical protein